MRAYAVFALGLGALLAVALAPGVASGSFLNFESGHVRPLARSPSGDLLFAVNTPDNRLEIFTVSDDGLEWLSSVVVGLEPVAVAARGDSEVHVVNHLSDSVSIVDTSDPSRPWVRRTLAVGDEPRDVVIAGPDRDLVFVTTAHRGQNNPRDPQLTTPGVGRADVWVFDADALETGARILTFFCDTPRALAASPDGTRVYVAAFHSGNWTTSLTASAVTEGMGGIIGGEFAFNDGFTSPGMAPPLANDDGVPAPETGLIVKFDGEAWRDAIGRDWTPRVRFDLSDRDVFVIDATQDPPVELSSIRHVGTILFNMAVHPVSGKIYVSNLESRNHVRFEPELKGHIAENRVTIIDGEVSTAVHLNPHIDHGVTAGDAGEIGASLAFPLGMEFSPDGETLYVAAFGSAKVGVLDAGAGVVDRITVGGGPSGLVLDADGGRLFVMNRFDQTISVVDTAARRETDVVPLPHNPEPAPVREGRPLLYDATNSGHGDAACASCHVFADLDSLAWNLGDPGARLEPNPLRKVFPAQDLTPFHPLKGPMTTQSLRGMAGAGPMHWRGDRNARNANLGSDVMDEFLAFKAFRPAFPGLLGMASPLPEEAMDRFARFILTVRYPPNPIARIDGTRTPEEKAGEEIYRSNGTRTGLGGDGVSCAQCHRLPLGTGGEGTFDGESEDFKVAHLRNLYQKVGMFGYALPSIVSESGGSVTLQATPTPHMGDQVRGFGYLHDGSVPTLLNFFRVPGQAFNFPDQPGRTGDQKTRELAAFMLSFDTGLAPVVGHQVTLEASSPASDLARLAVLRDRAAAGSCDLVLHGPLEGESRGFLYIGDGQYQSDRQSAVFSDSELAGALESGSVLTATATYPGSGRRLALDRDRDGLFDRDELDRGDDPRRPTVRLEAPWASADVGRPALAGGARLDGDRIDVFAAGAGIAGRSDELHFVYMEIDGDGSITARLEEPAPYSPPPLAGLMIREGLAADARHASLLRWRSGALDRTLVRYRETAGGGSDSSVSTVAPWLRLARSGHELIAWSSDDGESWSEVERVVMSLSGSVLVGVAVSAGDVQDDFFTVHATFSHLEIERDTTAAFLRGDTNGDGRVEGVTDAVYHLEFNFLGLHSPRCLAALDVNADGVTTDVTDPILLLEHSFLGGPAPAAPFPECGRARVAPGVGLDCEEATTGCE